MSTLFVTNYKSYLTTHEGFRLDNLAQLATAYDFYLFVNRRDYSPIVDHQRIFYSSGVLDPKESLHRDLLETIRELNISSVVNLVEEFFPWDFTTSARKVYFVRNCAGKLYQELSSRGAPSQSILSYKKWSELERYYIEQSDKLITDSPTSQQVLKETYNVNCDVAWEFINPLKFNDMPLPTSEDVYNVGRTDYQKNLHCVKPPKHRKFIHIGASETGAQDFLPHGIKSAGPMPFEQYKKLIEPCRYGLFPAFWESNGYAVQECLAMGKIPVVQKNSGGNERLCNPDNSVVFDFSDRDADWETVLDELDDRHTMNLNARRTLTYDMYKESLDRFMDMVCLN